MAKRIPLSQRLLPSYTRGEELMRERAARFLDELKAEDNHIIRTWLNAGLAANSAADSQALVHLRRNYCDRKDCLRCRFGYEYLKNAGRP